MSFSHSFLKIIIIVDIFCKKQNKKYATDYIKFLHKNNRTKWDTDLVSDFVLY